MDCPCNGNCACGVPVVQMYTIELRIQFEGTADEMERKCLSLEEITGGATSTVFDEEWEEV